MQAEIDTRRATERRESLVSVVAMIAVIASAAYSAFTWYNAKQHPLREIVYVDKWGTLRAKVISATIDAFRSKTELVAGEVKGSVRVSATKSIWILTGTQEIWLPATVNYTVDLNTIKEADVSFDPERRKIFVKLPPIRVGLVNLDVNHARQKDGGILNMNEDVREELRKMNYKNANAAFWKLANEPSRIAAAKASAQRGISALLQMPLKAIGSDLTVTVY